MRNPFALPGEFLKGNLHLHTTNSDGQLSPQEAVDLYRNAGYDFLAITDHRFLTDPEPLDSGDMVMLPGQELHEGKGGLGQVHHIVAIGMEEQIDLPATDKLQEAMDYMAPRCRFAFIAHPYWTSMTYTDILERTGFIGIEVFNFTCEVGIGRGDSGVHWDELLARGEKLFGFGVDDAHCHYGDTLGGWTMVKCADRTPDAIIDAIIAGDFYASSGPEILDVSFDGNEVTVKCSPCQTVNVVCPAPGTGSTSRRVAPELGEITEIAFAVNEAWDPFRIECIDVHGRKAWTNPFWADQ